MSRGISSCCSNLGIVPALAWPKKQWLCCNSSSSLMAAALQKKKQRFSAVKCQTEKAEDETWATTGRKAALLKTCRHCKHQFDPHCNHPRACRYHTAHFGGETKRKFESVYSGGTLNTPDSGKIYQYWHCCGSEDPFDPGCVSAPHISYDD